MTWLTASLLLILTAGFAKLTTVIVNRMLAIPQPKWAIGMTELVQLLLLPLYLGLVFQRVCHSPTASAVETLSCLMSSPIGAGLVLTGVFGLVLLVRSILAYQFYRLPACLVSSEEQILDFREDNELQPWQSVLVGPGPMRRIALLPGNQQYKLEISTKTFELARLPEDWNGVSIVHLADTHFRGAVTRAYFQQVCEQAARLQPDLYVFSGDLIDDPALLEWLPDTLGRLSAPLGQYFVLGNHDWYLGADRIRQMFEHCGWTDVSGKTHALVSPKTKSQILLAGDETPWMGSHPVLPSETQEMFRILLSHTPDNIDWARQQQIDLMLAGHTHGGQIQIPIVGPVYSPSRFGCQFASGAFWINPTLLYVSRGLSGREPIRFQCLPELTRLVLKRSKTN